MRLYATIPVRTDSGLLRRKSLRVTVQTLREAIRQADRIEDGVIHFAYNGPHEPWPDPLIRKIIGGLRNIRLRETWTTTPSKIGVVNNGLAEARAASADAFLCVDDDIIIPAGSLVALTSLYRRSGFSGATCAKAPHLGARPTAFQRLYSYAVQVSFRYAIAPKRPTGSLYCINPALLDRFPDGCNEGDVLSRLNLPLSTIPVFSQYPASMELEIARQRRLLRAASLIGFERFHDNGAFASSLLRLRSLPAVIDRRRFHESLHLWTAIRQIARD